MAAALKFTLTILLLWNVAKKLLSYNKIALLEEFFN